MAIGPLESFVFPGVYTRTLLEPPTPTAAGATRYPAIIGTAPEQERISAFEMVRGSSSVADNILLGENMAASGQGNVFDGVNVTFKVKHYPIVTGDGSGTFATDPDTTEIFILVNGERSAIEAVDGVNGTVTLVRPPESTDLVEANYFFKRRDTYVELEDVSDQVDGVSTTFKVHSLRIVKGDNGGNAATDPTITGTTIRNGSIVTVPVIEVLVNGIAVAVASINGGSGTFTLAAAPAALAVVKVSYFTNDWQNTYDILPASEITRIVQAGYSAGNSDFVQGRDYVLANENEIHWGNSFSIAAGVTTVGSPAFDGSYIQGAYMRDLRMYKVPFATGDGVSKTFALPFVPVRGDGTGRPVSDASNGTQLNTFDDVLVFAGASLGSITAIKVTKINYTQTYQAPIVTLQTAPAAGQTLFLDAYKNNYGKDAWTYTALSGIDAGKYTVSGAQFGSAKQVVYTAGTSTVTFKDSAGSNAFIAPSRNNGDETITVTVDAGGAFVVTSTGNTGSDNSTGNVGQTYVDNVTGFSFTLNTATAGNMTFAVTYKFTATTDPQYGIPCFAFAVPDIAAIAAGDTGIVNTYSMAANDGEFVREPAVGGYYYVTFDKMKVDFTVKYFTSMPDVTKMYGPIAQGNPISIAANLAFMNGAQAVAIKQVQKAPGSSDASTQSYISAIDEFNEPLSNSTRPSLIQVLTTNDVVINYLTTSNMQQCSIRLQNERTSFFGFRIGTSPEAAAKRAAGIKSELMTGVYPDSIIISVPNSEGVEQDIQVGGEYLAVALAGQDVSVVRDIATPLTNIEVVGIRRLGRRLNTATATQVAQSGVTVFEDRFGSIRTIMALTTDLTSALTRDPRIVEVKHFVQQGVRTTCRPFIGNKMLPSITGDIARAVTNYFASLQSLTLISAYQGITAKVDPLEPTTVLVTAYYKPVFGLNWIVATHYLRSTL